MSQDFVTRDELHRFEERLAAERTAFETRMQAEWKRFMGEVNGHIVRISEAAQNGRHDLIDSNQKMVEEFHRLQARIDRGEEGASRHRDSTAARLASMEEVVKLVGTTLKEFGELLEDLKRVVQAQARG